MWYTAFQYRYQEKDDFSTNGSRTVGNIYRKKNALILNLQILLKMDHRYTHKS